MVALNELRGKQARATEKNRDGCDMLLNYVTTYPNPKILSYASDMILHVDSDAAYLVNPMLEADTLDTTILVLKTQQTTHSMVMYLSFAEPFTML